MKTVSSRVDGSARRLLCVALFIVGAVGLTACGDDESDDDEQADVVDANTDDSGNDSGSDSGGQDDDTSTGGTPQFFAVNADFDYQIGGAYPPPSGVAIVVRDREDQPAADHYNICYVNGFQVQPDELGDWEADLVLRDSDGEPIIDPDWDEALLDISTMDKRSRIEIVVGGWIEQCAADGYDGVEIDNLGAYDRSDGKNSEDDAVAMMAAFADVAHANGLVISQKNAAQLLSRRSEMKTDFAMVEECNRYDECSDFTDAYGDFVLMVEYRDQDYEKGCKEQGGSYSVIRRDLDVETPESPSYVYKGC